MPGREDPVFRGEIKNQRKSLLRLIRSLSPHGEVLSFCYEAGPYGYGGYREIIDNVKCYGAEAAQQRTAPRRGTKHQEHRDAS